MKTLLATIALSLLSATAALAGSFERPAGDIILSVTGDIEHTNEAGKADFDMEMLNALAGRTGSMETPWTEGSTTFEGPLLQAILDKVGARGRTLVVKALNDYSAEVPIEDARDFPTILATRMNGEEMSVRDKGPLFLIYPFDKYPELYNEKYFSRSVWQIRSIEVVD